MYICSLYITLFHSEGPMNKDVLYLVGVFVLTCVAAMLRSYCFNVAGERFVARLRRNVRKSPASSLYCFSGIYNSY